MKPFFCERVLMKLVGSLILALAPTLVLAGPVEKAGPLGKKIDAFTLRDYRGAERSLSEFADRRLVVLAFIGSECPLARQYGPRLAELAKEYEPRGVAFLGINSNQQDSVSALGQYAKQSGITFPILKDVGNLLADRVGAQRTPEVFVLDAERVIRYGGRIDDQYGIGFNRPAPTRRDLATSLDELLAGKPVSVPITKAPGCYIGRVQREAKSGPVTYSKHIAPILQEHCVGCHRPGEIGPFALTSYDEAVGFADTIAEVVREGRMPPWHADPKVGHFANDRRLSDADRQAVLEWVENGAPEGDQRDLPKPRQFVEGWQIPNPNVVFRIPEAFHVPASGTVPYQFFVVESGFTEDKWVRAAEIRPSCRAVVHHVLVFVQPPGGSQDRRGGFIAHWLAGTVPGAPVLNLADGFAKRVPAGSRFVIQIHYTTNGAPQVDQTEVGLVFADPKTVRKEVSTEMVVNPKFAIPPHDGNYRVDAETPIEEDSLLLELLPHTHVRGKAFSYEAIYPDGKHEMLLDVPHYDFNWQTGYVLSQPKLLPKGTVLHCVAFYDNSENNAANPNPNETVRWGDQTWEEMMIGYYNAVKADEDLQKDPRPASHYTPPSPPPVNPALKQLAKHALDSQQAFDAFAAGVHKALPQVDRLDLSILGAKGLRIVRASYPGEVAKKYAPSGWQGESKMFALGHFGLLGRFFYFPDTSKLKAIDFRLLGQELKSSAHAPIVYQGRAGTVNFWSKKNDAFPQDEHALLQELARLVVVSRKT
jgi:thiol-disulfide isomerase/thioredoxin/mono/diheme cytochrome c family protein